ncbi:MAG: tyrosine recombinase [Actinobacteria bacterium]|nr:tyrosine recombinase [Actinomycetota bacterium]
MLLDGSIELYLKYLKYEKNLSPNSIRAYQRDIEDFLKYLRNTKNKKTTDINLTVFRGYMKSIDQKKYSSRTIIRKYSSIINFFRFNEDRGDMEPDIAQSIIVPKNRIRLYVFLTKDEISRLLETPDTEDDYGIRDRAILEILYSTGARVSEVKNMEIEDINLKAGEIKVTGKGRKQRIVFINNTALYWLDKYLKVRNRLNHMKGEGSYIRDSHLFLNKYGKGLSDRSIRVILKKYCARAGINRKASPHSIRHSFASHLLSEGAGIREIQELLGHENISTTQIYSHLNIKKLKEDYGKFHPRAG